jgi:cathepsin L
MQVLAAILALSTAVAAASQTTERSLGALVGCPADRPADSRCLWAGEDGQVVDSHTLRELLLQRNYVAHSDMEAYRRNLHEHMTYVEGEVTGGRA